MLMFAYLVAFLALSVGLTLWRVASYRRLYEGTPRTAPIRAKRRPY